MSKHKHANRKAALPWRRVGTGPDGEELWITRCPHLFPRCRGLTRYRSGNTDEAEGFLVQAVEAEAAAKVTSRQTIE